MGATKSHAEIQRAYRARMKQQNPELLRMREREKWRRQCLKKRSQLTIDTNVKSESCMQTHNATMKHRDISNYVNGNRSRHVVSELYPDDRNKNIDIFDLNGELSVKYPIHELLRCLENVDVDDSAKYRFMKYLCGEKDVIIEPSLHYNDGRAGENDSFTQRNTHTSVDERKSTPYLQEWRSTVWTPDQVQPHSTNHESSIKPIPIGSSCTFDVHDKLLPKRKGNATVERSIMPNRRKSGNKRTIKSSKKIAKNTTKNAYRKTTKQTTTTTRRNITVKGRKRVKWDPICFDNAVHDDDGGDVDENGM